MNPDQIYRMNEVENAYDVMKDYEITAHKVFTKVKYHAQTQSSIAIRKLRNYAAFMLAIVVSIPIWSYTLMCLWNWFVANDVIGIVTPFRAFCVFFVIRFFVSGDIFGLHYINSDHLSVVKQAINNKTTRFDTSPLSDSSCIFLFTLYHEIRMPLIAFLFGLVFRAILYF